MGKKNKPKSRRPVKVYTNSYEDRVYRVLSNLRHKDLQKECIKRGMPFELVTKAHDKLVSWIFDNFDNSQDETLLIQYDSYVENILKERGYKEGDALLSPALRFSYIGDIKKLNNPKEIKPKQEVPLEKKKKPKAEIDQKTGVRKGTKKALTFELAIAKKEIAEVIKIVLESFPEAQEKSIKIWYKKALKSIKK